MTPPDLGYPLIWLPHGTTKAREKETDDGRWGREGKEGGEREKLKEKTMQPAKVDKTILSILN